MFQPHIWPRFVANPNPCTRISAPETRDWKPETRSLKPESRNPKPETRNPKPAGPWRATKSFSRKWTRARTAQSLRSTTSRARYPKLKTQIPKPEFRNPDSETQIPKTGFRNPDSESCIPKSKPRSPRPESQIPNPACEVMKVICSGVDAGSDFIKELCTVDFWR